MSALVDILSFCNPDNLDEVEIIYEVGKFLLQAKPLLLQKTSFALF